MFLFDARHFAFYLGHTNAWLQSLEGLQDPVVQTKTRYRSGHNTLIRIPLIKCVRCRTRRISAEFCQPALAAQDNDNGIQKLDNEIYEMCCNINFKFFLMSRSYLDLEMEYESDPVNKKDPDPWSKVSGLSALDMNMNRDFHLLPDCIILVQCSFFLPPFLYEKTFPVWWFIKL